MLVGWCVLAVGAGVEVGLADGELPASPALKVPAYIIARDKAPAWQGNDALLFVSSRDIEGGPVAGPPNYANNFERYMSQSSVLFVRSKLAVVKLGKPGGKASAASAIFDVPQIYPSPAWAAATQRLAFSAEDAMYIYDLRDGTVGRGNDGTRVSRRMPAWNPAGTELAMSGDHSPADVKDKKLRGDVDIMVATVAPKLSILSFDSFRCVVHLPGADVLPVYSPDGEWIVFAHREPISDLEERDEITDLAGARNKKAWSLYRVRSEKKWEDPAYQAPEKLVSDLPWPERISWFPGGKSVLVSYYGSDEEAVNTPVIVDIQMKELKALTLPKMFDPELPDGTPLVVRDIVLSPAGDRIAFRALRPLANDPATKIICLYVSQLDGSQIMRVTPSASSNLPSIKFAQPGLTAAGAWAQLKPQPNLGRPSNMEEELNAARHAPPQKH